jgi:hypothetical protein
MKYEGVVIRIDELFLFILDPDTNIIRDGINISDHKCYDDLKNNQLMVVSVIFKDGTKEIDKIDLDEFIYGESYGEHDTFLYIHDIMLFSIFDNMENVDVNLKILIEKGKLNDVAINCISNSKKQESINE